MSNILLSMDQAAVVTGYAIFDEESKKYEYIGSWTITNDKYSNAAERLFIFKQNLSVLYDRYKFNKIVFEDIQLQRGNVKTFKTLAYIQATIMLWTQENGVEYEISSPSHWRSILKEEYDITWGRKREEQKAAAKAFAESQGVESVSEDECDAYCIGLAYLIEQDKPQSAF